MSKLSKISQSNESKEEFESIILEYLKYGSSREDLVEITGWSDHTVRNEVSKCAMFYPVLSHSSKRGYRIARDSRDLTEQELAEEKKNVRMALNELMSRVQVLNKRMKPLIAWLEAVGDE